MVSYRIAAFVTFIVWLMMFAGLNAQDNETGDLMFIELNRTAEPKTEPTPAPFLTIAPDGNIAFPGAQG
jgi:hypothetical protein